jgi:hypothetical protein
MSTPADDGERMVMDEGRGQNPRTMTGTETMAPGRQCTSDGVYKRRWRVDEEQRNVIEADVERARAEGARDVETARE